MYKCILLLLLPLATKAQSAELEQLTLDMGKLAELKSILQDMYSYYTILHQGYEDVKSIARGNFNLHQGFLDSLLLVSPAVSGDPRVEAILQEQAELLQTYAGTQYYPHLTAQEQATLQTRTATILDKADEDLDELSMVLTDGTLRMSDDERLEAIERVHQDMQRRLQALRKLTNAAETLSKQRAATAQTLQKLYGL